MGIEVFAGQLLFAVLVGSLVGIEREHARSVHKTRIPFGLRTTILFSVLGFLFTYFYTLTTDVLLLSIGVITAIIIATAVYLAHVWIDKSAGATTYVAMLIVFFTGALVGLGGYVNYLAAAILSIVVTAFLITKRILVNWTYKLTYDELFGAVKFGIIAFIILPLLPDRFIGPLNIINPFRIWYLVVAVSAIYFVSYVLLKHYSEKGLIFSALFGGLISSSVTAYNLSLWLKKNKALLNTVTGGIFLSCITGILGDLFVLAFVLNAWGLLLKMLPAMAVGMLVLFVFSYYYYEKKKHQKFEPNLTSPFALKPALEFGLFYVCLVAITSVLNSTFGSAGIYPIAFLAGLVSVSTFVVSIGSIVQQGQIAALSAAQAIIFTVIVSLFSKIFWLRAAKSWANIKDVAIGMTVTAAAMAATVMIQSMWFV